MRARILLILAFLPAGLAAQQQHLNARQAATTPAPDPFLDNARHLLNAYIPASVTPLLYSVYTSVESTTGDPASVIEAAFTAATPPAWLDAVPSELKSNVAALETAIASLRSASPATRSGVGWEPVATSVLLTGQRSSNTTAVQESSEVRVTSSGDSMTSATGSGNEASTTATTTAKQGGLRPPPKDTPSFYWGPSSAFAAPTGVPVVAAGIFGFFGAVLAL